MAGVAGKLGLKAVCYLNTGNYSVPTWSAVNSISDFTVDPTWDFTEAPTRASRMKLGLKTLLGLDISGKLRDSDSGDANFTTIMTALLTDSALDMQILNGPNTQNGVFGWRCDFQITKGSEDQGLNAVLIEDIQLKPAITVNLPNSVLVTAGNSVFTTI